MSPNKSVDEKQNLNFENAFLVFFLNKLSFTIFIIRPITSEMIKDTWSNPCNKINIKYYTLKDTWLKLTTCTLHEKYYTIEHIGQDSCIRGRVHT